MDRPRITLGAVNIEAADPAALAGFWAAAMGGTPVASEVDRLVALGAVRQWEVLDELPHVRWTTLADPEGNILCVAEHPPAS